MSDAERFIEDVVQAALDMFNEEVEAAIGSGEYTREEITDTIEDASLGSFQWAWGKWCQGLVR